MQQLRYTIYLAHWWIANAGVVAVPTYGWLRTQGSDGFQLGLEVAAALTFSACMGRLIEWARAHARMMGEEKTILNGVLAFVTTDGLVFATCLVGWGELTSAPGLVVQLIVAAVSTVAARSMRADSAKLAAWYGLR